jgi:EAL domain-containing protein (putative c-di-GMP-specific phosphodiesterase class I)
MAQRLIGCVRESDSVVRLGGDEFVLLITGLQKVEDVAQSMQRVLAVAAEPFAIEARDYAVTCSIGVSLYPDDGGDYSTLLRNADSAMYKAKQAGRNNFQFYTRELNDVLLERLDIEYRLRRAIEQDELRLHYQPKVDFASGRICGVEALLRWQPPGEAMVPPSSFIPVAEETGLIEEIGRWVLVTACHEARALKQKFGYPVPVAVNVSQRQFRQRELVALVESVLQESGLDAACLELEITESMLADDAEKFVETLHALKALGVGLAIDDFGTGYSSMSYLKHFPIDRLKIDKAFVDDLETDAANQPILRAIVALGHSLGLKVIAEGVENTFQYDYLRAIGCDEFQGYLYSKPVAAEDLERMLAAPDRG